MIKKFKSAIWNFFVDYGKFKQDQLAKNGYKHWY